MTHQQKGKFLSDVKHYYWENLSCSELGPDRIPRRCVSGIDDWDILDDCHRGPTCGHYGENFTARKVLDSGFYWPIIFKDAHALIKSCDACQRYRVIIGYTTHDQKHGIIFLKHNTPKDGNLRHEPETRPEPTTKWVNTNLIRNQNGYKMGRHEYDTKKMGQVQFQPLAFISLFWFPSIESKRFQGSKYILVAVDYVSKWTEAKALPTNDAKVVVNFVKSLETLKRYGVQHQFSTAYHPQANGQVENTNIALKRIQERTVDGSDFESKFGDLSSNF
ncbi:hypothetical protein OSB04_019534 [Centaurea solstitialis]|uniref:Integrase zinc-binding domain-containing protein n=1 Tax=Centaurea solstitialis TaxID=347529 RepID=A0AA38T3Z7_9ASTR|nr:hypothetical protein OSB04_019534 [Centaurea solstitialis]